MAVQKAASKKAVAGKVGTDKVAAVKAGVVEPAKKAAPKKTVKAAVAAEPKKTKPAVQKEATVAAAVSKPVAKKAASGQRKDIRQTEATSAAHSPEQRYRMVEMAAYFIAERNGFQGDAAGHWQVAELEIAQLLDA